MTMKTFLTSGTNGEFPRLIGTGELYGMNEIVGGSLTTAGAGALLSAILANNIINRTGPTGAVADTTDSADAIIAATGLKTGGSYRCRFVNNVAFAITITAPDATVVVTNPIVNASSVKDFLITAVNATRQTVVPAVGTTNGNKILTGFSDAQLALITPGMLVTGTGIGASAKVVGVGNGQVTVDVNSSATAAAGAGTGVTVTFNPNVTILGIGQMLL